MILLLLALLTAQTGTLETITVQAFADHLKKEPGVILDVRKPEEFQEGHVANAENLNFYDADFAQKLSTKPKDQTYYIYCRSGGRSGKTLEMMKQAGFQKVYEMEGGMTAWEAANMPVQK